MTRAEGPWSAARDEQRLERREKAADFGAWAARLGAAAHRGSDGRSPRNGERVLEGGRDRSPRASRSAGTKTGQFDRGAHRLLHGKIEQRRQCAIGKTGQWRASGNGAGKTGQSGAHRPYEDRAADGPTGSEIRAGVEPVRAVPGSHPAVARPRAQRNRHWQQLVDEHGFAGSYSSVRRFVVKLRGTQAPEARAVIETAGRGGASRLRDGADGRDESGKYRRTRLFVFALGYSRKSVRLLVFRSSARVWAELHEKAFRRLGGAVRVVVLDNLKEGVLLPDVYDPLSAVREQQEGIRRIQGILALARKYGAAAVDDACAAALEVGVPTYRFVRRYLERRPAAPLTTSPSGPAHSTVDAIPRSHRPHHPGGSLNESC